ncbi:hypothetical protein AMATHDRAFT_139280 [Amanita thiersii Skay4041]|uniref:Dolichyl-diphosphooligosaccharide--protein glycosyltransferase subunit 1 n=1 Tax=Amanita thiersii Skay4041 TaxID=703135 RepID=A0A2A9NWL1_9AGAR|nr:hypothetical protein AMATHDRAFT_139280 [Amanita thiersii Skay4041]
MLTGHPLLLYILVCVSSVLAASSPSTRSFENSAIVRTFELGGSLVHVTTTYAIKALESGAKTYTLALSSEERRKASWLEVKVKGQEDTLPIVEHIVGSNKPYHLIDVKLPKALPVNGTLNIVLETIQTHATEPWPAKAAQTEEQAVKFTTDLFVVSPYSTAVQRTKLRTLSPRIITYTIPENLDQFTSEATASKSSATVTYGPYNNIPPSTNTAFYSKHQMPVTIHYNHDHPILEILTYDRSAEISHWGANLNIEDKIHLFNAGPELKGHFSRIQHQMQAFYGKPPPHVLPAMNLDLPPNVRNVYYYDLIGNVSTSRLRVAPPVPKGSPVMKHSALELRPRYPIMGGWNYTFTLGWDAPLGDSVAWDAKNGKYIAEIPVMLSFPGAVVNDARINVILPEGATDIEVSVPYPAVENTISTHTTYLDSTGRPKFTFIYKNLTTKHIANIYVTYKVSSSAHLKKPLVVATAFFSVFTIALITRRIDLTIHPKKKAK